MALSAQITELMNRESKPRAVQNMYRQVPVFHAGESSKHGEKFYHTLKILTFQVPGKGNADQDESQERKGREEAGRE